MFYDCHSHTNYSVDATIKPEDAVQNAIECGFLGYAFTDHCDLSLDNTIHGLQRIENCCREVEVLKEMYKGKIKLFTGLELADGFFMPELYRIAHSLHDYDIILGSVHITVIDNKYIDIAKVDFSDASNEDMYRLLDAYIDLYKNTVYHGDYDVFCHLTYPLRYFNGKYNRGIQIDKYTKDIEDIMKICISKGMAMEINVAKCTTKNPTYFCPERELVSLYKSLGGKMITIGSDLHVKENKYPYFEEAEKMLKEHGYDELYYFEKRKPISYKI